jgi:hypothetical protein
MRLPRRQCHWVWVVAVVLMALVGAFAWRAAEPVRTDFDVGSDVGEAGPMHPGDLIWLGTNTLNVTSDAEVTLVDLIPLGLAKGSTVDELYMPIAGTDGALGEHPDALTPAANRRNARPMAGVAISKADGYFQLLVTIVMPVGGLTVHGYRLTYRVGSEMREVYIPHSQHLCDAATLIGRCPDVRPYP